MKKTLAILIVMAMLLGLCACGGGGEAVDEALLGVYTCYEAETEGIKLAADMIFTDSCTLTLEENGKGEFYIDGDEFGATYTIDGNAIELTSDGDTITGTIGDGLMEIDMDGVILYMSKDGEQAAAEQEAAAEETTEDAPAEEAEDEAPAATGSFTPVTGDIGDYTLTIVAAEYFDDIDEEPAIRFYYDYTNNTDDVSCPWMDLEFYATQEGYELTETYDSFDDDVPEYDNDGLYILPGMTIRCIEEFSFKPDGGMIEFTAEEWYSEETLVAEFDPANLPGRPTELEMPTITECTWAADLDTTGSFDDGLYTYTIGDYEVVDGTDSTKVLRVFVDFTNNGEETTSFFMEANYYALQDGVEIQDGYPMESNELDGTTTNDVEPGQTVTCTLCFELRSDSPVELIVEDVWDDATLGMVIPVA